MKKDLNTSSSAKELTLRKRSIYVYLPSVEMADKWKKLSDDSGVSISKFVTEHVENSLLQEEDEEDYEPRIELIERNKMLLEENLDLKKRGRMLDTVVDRLEGELREYRVKPFVDEDFSGVREYQSELVDLFKKRGMVRKNEVLDLLGINASDSVVIKGVGKQIKGLEEYGLIKDVGSRWKWVV